MHYVEQFKNRFGNPRAILLLGLLYLCLQAIIVVGLQHLGTASFFSAQTTFSMDVYLRYLHGWQEAGLMGYYRGHYRYDFILPFLYSLFLAAILSFALMRNGLGGKWNALVPLPFVAGALDLVENVFHLFFINAPESITPVTIFASALAANLKWGLSGIAIVAAVALLLRAWISRRRPSPPV